MRRESDESDTYMNGPDHHTHKSQEQVVLLQPVLGIFNTTLMKKNMIKISILISNSSFERIISSKNFV